MATCSECDKPAKARGFCVVHYSRFMRYGRTTKKKWDGYLDKDGYRVIPLEGKKYGIREHIHKAELAIGHKLPNGAHVHHVNENRSDNRNENLVVCPSIAYHKLLHMRQDAYSATGNANMRKCVLCKKYDVVENLGKEIRHKKCHSEYMKGTRNV